MNGISRKGLSLVLKMKIYRKNAKARERERKRENQGNVGTIVFFT